MNLFRVLSKQSLLRLPENGKAGFTVLALLVPILILIILLGGTQRSFLIDARTSYVQIRVDGANAWRFPEATLCLPRQIPDRNAVSEAGAPCAAMSHSTEQLFGFILSLTDGLSLALRAESQADDTRIRIILSEGLRSEYPAGTEVVIQPSAWRQTGALLFSGNAVLGNILGSGERHYLHSADWEARQTSWSTRFRGATDIVMAGEFMRGAQITVAKRVRQWYSLRDEVARATVYGHITPATTADGLPVFATTLASEPGRTELQVGHYGLDSRSTIRPDFIDTLATSDLLLVIIAVSSLLTAAVQAIRGLGLTGRSGKEVCESGAAAVQDEGPV